MPNQLIDKFSRKISYLRVSITDHCNYKCFYCRDENDIAGSLRKDILTHEELTRIIRIFTELGVQKIRLTGGEPLIRNGIVDLVGAIGNLPKIQDFSMSTNAHLLPKMAQSLFDKKLQRLNISLDSLDDEKFTTITRGGDLSIVLDGIQSAKSVGFHPIKINMVVMRGLNGDEIEPMLDYAIANNLQLRFIETMPIGQSGVTALKQHYPSDKILERVKKHLGKRLVSKKRSQTDGPAQIFNIIDKKGNDIASVGVISAVSQHFCETCNRVRLTAKGDLVLCLGQENSVSLLKAIRFGKTDDEIKAIIIKAIDNKPEKHDFNDDKFKVANQNMVALGG